jgi:uncharacterized protein YdeI (YjbR/CyaY-like superfamily)
MPHKMLGFWVNNEFNFFANIVWEFQLFKKIKWLQNIFEKSHSNIHNYENDMKLVS